MNLSNYFNKFTVAGNYEIYDLCLETYPCKHSVKNTVTGEMSIMSGAEIFILLKDMEKSDEHFDIYAEYIRKRDHPTPEEIYERENRETRLQEQNERLRIKKEEQKSIINQYKASSRLERLKAKHNVC